MIQSGFYLRRKIAENLEMLLWSKSKKNKTFNKIKYILIILICLMHNKFRQK